MAACTTGQEAKDSAVQVKETLATYHSVDKLAAGGKAVLDKYGALIARYHGIVPASVAAVRIWVECRGNPKSYSSVHGEAGLLQLWPADLIAYGVTNWADPEQNLKAGFAKWARASNTLVSTLLKVTGIPVSVSDPSFWALANFNTAVGAGATEALLKKFGSWNGIRAVAYSPTVDSQLRPMRGYFGHQAASCIAHRIITADRMYQAASQLGLGGGGILTLALAAVGGYFLMQYLKSRGVF